MVSDIKNVRQFATKDVYTELVLNRTHVAAASVLSARIVPQNVTAMATAIVKV